MSSNHMFEIEYDDNDMFLVETLTFEEYLEFYKMYKNGGYIIEPTETSKGIMLSDFTCNNRDFLFSEDSFNAAEYLEILLDYRKEFFNKMVNIDDYFKQMEVNRIISIKCDPNRLDIFLEFLFECYEKMEHLEGETQNGMNERSYILASIIYYSFNNPYDVILGISGGNIMGINNNDRFNNSRYVKFDIRNSRIFRENYLS